MKLVYFVTVAPFLLTACSTTMKQEEIVNMANSASVFCEKQGGKSIIKNTPEGQVGYCRFKDGKEVEEWEFFRKAHGES